MGPRQNIEKKSFYLLCLLNTTYGVIEVWNQYVGGWAYKYKL